MTEYTKEQIDVVAEFAALLARAHEAGLVVEIEYVSPPPLRMGNLLPVISARHSREYYTAEAACKHH